MRADEQKTKSTKNKKLDTNVKLKHYLSTFVEVAGVSRIRDSAYSTKYISLLRNLWIKYMSYLR